MNEREDIMRAEVLHHASLILEAFDDLIDTECPNCLRPLDLPSLEDIQEWLKEEK